jgi:ABC-type phosphate/phosphonate transport system substrate-binding protein
LQNSPRDVARREVAIRGEKSKPAAHARAARQTAAHPGEVPRAKIANLHPACSAAAGSDIKRAKNGDSRLAGGAAATAVPAPESKADNTDRSNHSEAVRGDAERTAAGSPNDADRLVAILLARPEIKSVSDLAGKSIAIDDGQSPSSASVRTAIAAAGAAGVQLSEGQTTAINRVASGEVPAAVLTLESPEAAETFPEIEGYKIFRIPLSPRSFKARVDRP